MAKIEKWATKLEKEAVAYLRGGINMVLRGLTPSTKDVDILVEDKEDYNLVEKALTSSGYEKAADWTPGDKRAYPSNIFIHPSLPRVDLFTEKVSGIKLSEAMRSRVSLGIRLGNLRMMLLDLNDVDFLKLLTARERDVNEVAEIVRRHGVDWKIIVDELMKLPKETLRKKMFLLLDNIGFLKGRGLRVLRNIFAQMRKVAVDSAIEYMWRKGVTDLAKIAEYTETSPAYVRKRLKELRMARGFGREGIHYALRPGWLILGLSPVTVPMIY